MSNFQNSWVCWLYFFSANVLCFPCCNKSLLWKEPVRPRSPGHSTPRKGLNSAMPELRAESQSIAPSLGLGLGAAGHVLTVGPGAPRCTFSPWASAPAAAGALHGAVPVLLGRAHGTVKASCWARALSPLVCAWERGLAMAAAGGTRHRASGRAGRVPASAQAEHVGVLRWCWGAAAVLLVTLLNFAGEMSWCLAGC